MDSITPGTQNADIYTGAIDNNIVANYYNMVAANPSNETNYSDYKPLGMCEMSGDTASWPEFLTTCWNHSTEHAVYMFILYYMSPVLVILGTAGNVISYLVLRHRLMRQNSVYFYMALYALANTLILNMNCGQEWLVFMMESSPIANQADWICRLWNFIISVVKYGPSWLVVLMVFDRFIYLCIPSKAHGICTVFTAKVLSTFALVVLVAVGIHAMWTFQIAALDGHGGICELANWSDFQTKVWPWIAAIFNQYLPMTLVIVLDALILLNTAILSARQYQSRNYSPLQQQLTGAVLAISVAYLVLTLPHVVVNIMDHIGTDLHATYKSYKGIYFCSLLFVFLIYFLYTINFPLYFITMPPLRKELVVWFKFVTQKKSRQADDRFAIECNGQLLNKDKNDSKTQIITQL